MIKDRTLDDYKRAGAWMRLLKTALAKTYIDGTPDGKYRSDVDKEQTELTIKLVKELFEDNWE